MNASKLRTISLAAGICLTAGVLAVGCSAPQVSAPPAAASAPRVAFTWEAPQACVKPATVPVTFAVVRPVWQTVAGSGSMLDAAAMTNPQVAMWIRPRQDLYDEFASAMRNDFFALLTCKGFTTRGPFASYQEMVFPDRMGSDLVMAPEIDIRLAVRTEAVAPSLGSALLGAALGVRGAASSTKLTGDATLSGRVTVAIRESVTDTRMWTRSVEIPAESFAFTSSREYPVTAQLFYNEIVTGDPAFIAALGPRLAEIYRNALAAAWNYTDPQEMRLVRSQSLDVRNRAISGIARE